MVIGFLASEGIIRKYEDIDSVWVQEKEGFVHVTTTKVNPYYEQMQNKRYITSCCGMSRQGFVFANDALSAKMKGVHVQVCRGLFSVNERNAAICGYVSSYWWGS